MFEHLKLLNVRGVLQNQYLTHLGKINVICGKNNSGKSTVLEGIESQERVVGRTLRYEDSENLQCIPQVWHPRGSSSQDGISRIPEILDQTTDTIDFELKYLAAVREVLNDKPIWFDDELGFAKPLIEGKAGEMYDTNIFAKVDVDSPAPIKRELHNANHVLLIPAKRSVVGKSQFMNPANRPPLPYGDNLISALFLLKNSEGHSDEFRFFQQLSRAFFKVSSGHKFNVTQGKDDELVLRFATHRQDEISSDLCGLGLQDLLLILYFSLRNEGDVILIEEPENHIHPEIQRKLLKFLSEESKKQFFITTHSNVFLNSTYVDRVFFTTYKNRSITVSDATSRARVLHDLGYAVTDNLVSDLIILVEGSGDKAFFEEFLSKYDLDAKYNVKIWILGGDEMVNQDLSAFRQDYQIMAVVDQDPLSAKAREAFISNCKEYDIPVRRLARYSLESYFTKDAIDECFNKYDQKIPETKNMVEASFGKRVKSEPLWEILGSTAARKKGIKGRLKRKVREIAREMSIENIESTDLADFFSDVKKTLNNG